MQRLRSVEFRAGRLRAGELVAAAGGLALLVIMFAVPWYGTAPPCSQTDRLLRACRSYTAWGSLSLFRWVVLVTAISALALFIAQGTRRSPAVPASLSVIVTSLGIVTVLGLIVRVLIAVPAPATLHARDLGSYLGLAAALVTACGGYASLRREGIAAGDAPEQIPIVRLGSS